jgi:hypothetical protein
MADQLPEEFKGYKPTVNLGVAIPDLTRDLPTVRGAVRPTTPVSTGPMGESDRLMQKLSSAESLGNTLPVAFGSEIDMTGRFPQQFPGTDNEQAYAVHQGLGEKAINGVVKFGGIATSAFLNGTVGIVAGITSAIIDHNPASFWKNSVSEGLNDFTKELENSYAHYKTERERKGDWWEPANLFTGNFFFDNIVKNLGYTVGALGSGFAINGLLRTMNLTSKIAGFGAKWATAADAAIAENVVAGEVASIARTTTKLESILAQAKSSIGNVLKDPTQIDRAIVATTGTAAEAGFEALNNSQEFRERMIAQFKEQNGYDPTQEDIDEINAYAESVGNFSWLANTALLTVTNYIQLPKIMSSTFSIYNTLSATYWRRVDFNVVGEQFDVKKTPLLFDNGMYFYLHDTLSDSVDFTFNKKTGTFLTKLIYNSYFLENKKNPDIVQNITKIESPIKTVNGNIVTFYNSNSSLPNNPTVLLDTSNTIFGVNDVITFSFEENNKVSVKNKIGNVLTADYFGINGLTFKQQIYPPSQTQLFDYFLGESSIILFKSNTNYTNIVTKGSNNVYVLSSVSLAKSSTLPSNAIFNFVSYKNNTLNFDNSISDSFIAKYKVNPIFYQNILDIDYDISNRYSPFLVTSGLTSWLDFSNSASYPGTGTTVTDLSPNAGSASLRNGASYNNTSGGVIVLNGASQSINITNNLGLLYNSTSASVFIWVYPSSPGQIVDERAHSGSWNDSQIEIQSDGTIHFSVWQPGYANKIVSPPQAFNQWYLLGFTYDGTTFKAYINGQVIGSTLMTRQAPYYYGVGMIYCLGHADGTNMGVNQWLNGKIGAFYAYNRALTIDEALQNFNGTKTRYIGIDGLSQNYLGLFPVENPTINNTDCSYDLQVHGLKNYQTPEYKYTTANPYKGMYSSIRREYNKIYTGTNQLKGYDNVYLGFNADTKEYRFKVDEETPFYYPSTSQRTPLSSSGLIEDGAIAGELPFTSDRVYTHRKNYEETIPGKPQPASITKYDNVWLCSWLSGSNLGDKIWLDRYYNAAYYTLDQAMTAKAIVYNPSLYPNKPFTYDVPSATIFEPGVLYKYNRTGQDSSKNFLTYLDQDRNLPNGAKLLSISNWLSSTLVDDSNYHNNGLVFFNVPENLKGNYWVLDGTNHAVFPSKSSLLQKSRLTLSMWLNVDDWSNIYGDQIFGNYYDSGFGLINEGALGAPILTITNVGSAVAYNVNYKFTKLSEIPLPAKTGAEYTFIQRLPDYSYWTFDSYNKTGVRYNAINNITGTLSSLANRLSGLDQIEIDSYQNFYFYDNSIKSYVKTDGNGNFITQGYFALNSGINRIEINNETNNVISIYGNSSVIDNYNNIWEVVGGNLYKNRQVFANVGPTQQLTCDSGNNIWISHNQDTISKLNTINGLFEFSFRIGRNSSAPLDPCKSQDRFRYMNFVKVPKGNSQTCDSSVSYEDNLIIIDNRDNEIYTLDQTGNLLSKLDIRALLSDPNIKLDFYARGDFTGYQYLRKFGGNIRRLSWKFKIAEPNGNNSKLLSLNYAVSSLPKGWHNFSFIFDSLNGNAKYFIDSILVDSVSFAPLKYQLYYDYRSSLLLGAASIKNTTLNDIIGIDDSYKFIGNVADLRMYSKSLTNGELEQIYFSSDFADSRKDLNWNMRVGTRNFIEEIEHWYKMKMPGSKSKYFNINVHNLNIDDTVKKIIEDSLKASISKIIPAESSLYKINWM